MMLQSNKIYTEGAALSHQITVSNCLNEVCLNNNNIFTK